MSAPAYTAPKQLQQKPMNTMKHKWAWGQKTGSSAAKLVLLALARRANENLLAYPSVKCLSDDTELNRKTVLHSLSKLIDLQLIADTGYRTGSTKQVVVYKLQIDESLNSTEFGTVNNETVPFLPINSTVFTVKESQKRDMEELLNNKDKDTPPYNPPASGGDDTQDSPIDSPASTPASQEHDDAPTTKTNKRTQKNDSEENSQPSVSDEEFEKLRFKRPCRLDPSWLEGALLQNNFREVFAEEGIKPLQRHWKLISTAFELYFTEAKGAKALKKDWAKTFENWVRKSLNDNAFRWRRDQEERSGNKQRSRSDPNYADIDLDDPAFQARIQRAMIEGALERGEITLEQAKEEYGYEQY